MNRQKKWNKESNKPADAEAKSMPAKDSGKPEKKQDDIQQEEE